MACRVSNAQQVVLPRIEEPYMARPPQARMELTVRVGLGVPDTTR